MLIRARQDFIDEIDRTINLTAGATTVLPLAIARRLITVGVVEQTTGTGEVLICSDCNASGGITEDGVRQTCPSCDGHGRFKGAAPLPQT